MPIHLDGSVLEWRLVGQCVRGFSHVRAGTVCQDAYRITAGASAGLPWIAAAVGDGHGDPRHDRSDAGAALACSAALAVIEQFIDGFADPGDALLDGEAERRLHDALKHDFGRRVSTEWRERIKQDHESRETGRERAADNAVDSSRYGTTLLAVVVVPTRIWAIRLGDGDILVRSLDGQIAVLFPERDDMVGGQTLSMSSPDARILFQIESRCISEIDGFFLCTDGLRNACEDESRFIDLIAYFSQLIEQGNGVFSGKLPSDLERVSTEGSGDDVTLVVGLLEPGDRTAALGRQPESAQSSPRADAPPRIAESGVRLSNDDGLRSREPVSEPPMALGSEALSEVDIFAKRGQRLADEIIGDAALGLSGQAASRIDELGDKSDG